MNKNFLNRLSILAPLTFLLAIIFLTTGILFYWNRILGPTFLKGEKTKAELIMIYAVDNLEQSMVSDSRQGIEDVMRRLLVLKAPNSSEGLILALSVTPLSGEKIIVYATDSVEIGGPFSVSSPLYSSTTQELLGEVTLQYNNFFYKQLLADAKKRLSWTLGILLCIMIVLQRIIAWLLKPLSRINVVLGKINFNKTVEFPEIKGHVVLEIGRVISALKDLLLRLEESRKAEKKAKDNLIESEKNYRLLIETIPHGIHKVDSNGILIYANKAYTEITGFSKEEVVGKMSFDFIENA